MATQAAARGVTQTESQFYEGGATGSAELLPAEAGQQAVRRRQVRAGFAARNRALADRFREPLTRWYGADSATTEFAEAFELCEYGRQPSADELRQLFPFLPER